MSFPFNPKKKNYFLTATNKPVIIIKGPDQTFWDRFSLKDICALDHSQVIKYCLSVSDFSSSEPNK